MNGSKAGSTMKDTRDAARGALVGLAVGDAIGTTVEFCDRGSFEPLTDMVGGGPFDLDPGQWTDDTSMALCLAHSLAECGFDPRDQMERYVRWWRQGYMSSTGNCFDIGNTVRTALSTFEDSGDPTSGTMDEWSAGNGSIMRLAPVPIFFYPDRAMTISYSGESSLTTHGLPVCRDACRLLGTMVHEALKNSDKLAIMRAGVEIELCDEIAIIARQEWDELGLDDIRGSGYVVDSLKAACWCFARSSSFEEAVLDAANLGDDADTTAAVSGQLAGAYYGFSGIPRRWTEKLHACSEIMDISDSLLGLNAV